MKILPQPIRFEWDAGNQNKNWTKHQVANEECEEVFFDPHMKVMEDETHSEMEHRNLALGKTAAGRFLFVVFTERGVKVRVISARNMSRKERKAYHEKIEENTSDEK